MREKNVLCIQVAHKHTTCTNTHTGSRFTHSQHKYTYTHRLHHTLERPRMRDRHPKSHTDRYKPCTDSVLFHAKGRGNAYESQNLRYMVCRIHRYIQYIHLGARLRYMPRRHRSYKASYEYMT